MFLRGINFNPRSRAGSDALYHHLPAQKGISIHAPRAGGDAVRMATFSKRLNFNPRPPCGGRQKGFSSADMDAVFQSTPPVRGATLHYCSSDSDWLFQSTPPVRGATEMTAKAVSRQLEFQSTPPVRGATQLGTRPGRGLVISIHAPRAGGDCRRVIDNRWTV